MYQREFNYIQRYGFFRRISQIILSIYFILFKFKSEKNYLKECFNNININILLSLLNEKKIDFCITSNYDSNESLEFINSKKPDFLVSHTPYWISKKIRNLPVEKLVIGSHPGIVPNYRGAHSAFWSRFKGDDNLNGYSIFSLDNGVDSGPLISQNFVKYDETISFRCNDYLIMKHCSEEHANIVEKYSNGKKIEFIEQKNLSKNQIYKAPGIFDYLRFIYKFQ